MAVIRVASRWDVVEGLRVHARFCPGPGAAGPGAAGPARLPWVLVHGLSVSSDYLVRLARRLAALSAVYAVDLPGFGRSQKPPRPLDIDGLAHSLEAWLSAVGVPRANLFGHSAGSQVIAAMAQRSPQRVACAVLAAPSVDAQARTWHQTVGRVLADIPFEPPTLIPLVLLANLQAGPVRTVRSGLLMLQDAIEERLPYNQQPTLIVRGTHDPVIPQRWAERLAGLLPNGRLVVVPGCGHGVNFSRPACLAKIIRDFEAETSA